MKECRPFWQDRPCPVWCAITHADGDFPEDRFHRPGQELAAVLLTTNDPIRSKRPDGEWCFEPPVLHVDLEQHTRETTPRILLGDKNSTGYSLTTTEATTLAHALLTAGALTAGTLSDHIT